jgi:hypothetical protein
MNEKQRIASDLVALTRRGAITTDCLPISVPYATPVPLLALYLHTSPVNVKVAPIGLGTYIVAADQGVYVQYQLDKNDPQRSGGVPSGFRSIAANRSWHVYASCRGPKGPQ